MCSLRCTFSDVLKVSISFSPGGTMSNDMQGLACYTTDDLVIYKTF